MSSKTVVIPIVFPKPHTKQRDFIDNPAKRKVIVSGRRGGKTTGVSMLATKMFVKGSRILYAAPTQEQTDMFWENCKRYLVSGIDMGVVYKNETKRILETPVGRIKAKTAWNADTLRGDYADLLILEEYAMMDPDTWDEVGAPMLLDNDGDAVFISTPKRRNHFFSTYQKALNDISNRWACWHFTSHDNPYLSQEALGEITKDMTAESYQQEIMAVFLENEGAVFRNIDACLNAPSAAPEQHNGHLLIAGVDWGKHQDFTAISIGCVDCKAEVDKDRFNKIDYTFQRNRLASLVKQKWNVAKILAESNAMGEPNIDQLRTEGFPIRGFQTTAVSKPQLIMNLALSLEREEWQFQNDPIWKGELEAYEQKVNATTGRSTYSAPQGMNDDTVIARALMVRAADEPYGQDLYAFI